MASKLQQAKYILRRTRDWVRHDLPEIVFPSSLPDPPGYVAAPPTPLREWLQVHCLPTLVQGLDHFRLLLCSAI